MVDYGGIAFALIAGTILLQCGGISLDDTLGLNNCYSKCEGNVLHSECFWNSAQNQCVCEKTTDCAPDGECRVSSYTDYDSSETRHYAACVNTSCETTYPACGGKCASGTCRQPEFSSACACCGDGVVDELAKEECETDEDCAFHPDAWEGTVYKCVNCECEGTTPTPSPAPDCGDGKVEGWEECEKSEDCSDWDYCYDCRCIPDENYVTPTPTPSPTPSPTPELKWCGNGLIEAGERCDVGAKFLSGKWWPAAKDTCPSGQTCVDCACIEREITPRCGDCYISDETHGGTEECDMGNSLYCAQVLQDTCAYPKHCFNCKCVLPDEGGDEGYCGDGEVNNYEDCEESWQCPSGYYCSSCHCIQTAVSPTPTPAPTATPYEAWCGNGVCDSNEVVTYTEAGTGYTCTVTSCEQDCPGKVTNKQYCSRNCLEYANYVGYSSVIGIGVDAVTCQSSFDSWCAGQQKTCTTTCCYASYAALGGCCVADAIWLPCTDCPGENPYCPGQGSCPSEPR